MTLRELGSGAAIVGGAIVALCIGFLCFKATRWFHWKVSYGPKVEERLEGIENRLEQLEMWRAEGDEYKLPLESEEGKYLQ
jgi:hypothetical protein